MDFKLPQEKKSITSGNEFRIKNKLNESILVDKGRELWMKYTYISSDSRLYLKNSDTEYFKQMSQRIKA